MLTHLSAFVFSNVADVLSEDEILKWYKGNDSPKGKAQFNEQMKKLVDWLNTAEEGE